LQQLHAGSDRMHVRVVEAGCDQASRQIDLTRLLADEGCYITDRDDLAIGDGDIRSHRG